MVEVCEAPLMTCVPQNQVVALRADRGVSLTWKNVRRVRFSSCGRLSFIHVNVQLYWAWHRTSGISWRCCSCSNSEIASSKILLRCHLFTHTHVNGTCFTYGAHSSQNVRGSRQTNDAHVPYTHFFIQQHPVYEVCCESHRLLLVFVVWRIWLPRYALYMKYATHQVYFVYKATGACGVRAIRSFDTRTQHQWAPSATLKNILSTLP